jgi:hypothetical protein
MRKFKPAPKQASANRIRERYLHQLGLQRGAAIPNNNDQFDNHHHQVVVISGLPSLPEDRATNDDNTRGGHVLESHDFSSYGDEGGGCIALPPTLQLHHPFPPPHGGGDSSYCSRSTLSTSPHNNMGGSNNVNVANEHITSMALACPHSLLKNSHQYYGGDNNNNTGSTTTTNNNNSTGALPFSLSWGRNSTCQLSRSAAAVLSAEVPGGGASSQPAFAAAAAAFRSTNNNDHYSVSSAATATTAESSFTATMVSRDWGNASATPAVYYPSGTASVSSLGGDSSIASAPGVFFQGRQHCPGISNSTNNHRFTPPSSYNSKTTGVVGTLASALNRFNIDSDCEVSSVASNSIMEDPTSMMEDCNIDDSASCASRTSHVSCEGGGGGGGVGSVCSISSRSQQRVSKKKKVGKNQRLMDRALAHEHRMQMRKEQSQKLRANMVHSQRMNHCSLGGLPTMPHQSLSGQSCSSSSTTASSIPLMHVHHQATPLNTPNNSSGKENTTMEMLKGGGRGQLLSGPLLFHVLPKHPSFGSQDLGRTPTASNCSQYTKGSTTAAPNMVLPVGVHSNYHFPPNNGRPLGCQPQLASRIPTPPPPRKVAPAPSSSTASSSSSVSLPSSSNAPSRDELLVVSESNSTTRVSEMEMDLANVVSSLQHCKHGFGPPPAAAAATTAIAPTEGGERGIEDDVMEVAVTLSMLGGSGRATPSSVGSGGGGMIPRVR